MVCLMNLVETAMRARQLQKDAGTNSAGCSNRRKISDSSEVNGPNRTLNP